MKIRVLSKRELRRMFENNVDFVLVNVLPESRFNEEHIPGSLNLHIEDKSFETRLKQQIPEKSRKIVVYSEGYNCRHSKKAVARMKKIGYAEVYDYEGGIKDWKNAGYPVVSEEKLGR